MVGREEGRGSRHYRETRHVAREPIAIRTGLQSHDSKQRPTGAQSHTHLLSLRPRAKS